MEKISVLLFVALFGLNIQAQITLMDEFAGTYTKAFGKANEEERILMIRNANVKIFDKNFDLKKDIYIPEEWGEISFFQYLDEYQSSARLNIGTVDFFNQDALIEFIVLNVPTSEQPQHLAIINENNEILWSKKWESGYKINQVRKETCVETENVCLKKTEEGKKYMIIHLNNAGEGKTEIYSIAGSIPSRIE